MLPQFTKVYRDGEVVNLESSQVVPGDIFVLQAGDAIPVDARLIEATSLQVDESASQVNRSPNRRRLVLRKAKVVLRRVTSSMPAQLPLVALQKP